MVVRSCDLLRIDKESLNKFRFSYKEVVTLGLHILRKYLS